MNYFVYTMIAISMVIFWLLLDEEDDDDLGGGMMVPVQIPGNQ